MLRIPFSHSQQSKHLYSIVQARCLFATHYHELTALKDKFVGIESFYAASKKTKRGIVFLYRMIKGVADGSFGLDVAKLAHLPDQLIDRADAILHSLTNGKETIRVVPATPDIQKNGDLRAKILHLERQIREQEVRLRKLRTVDYDDLSPKKAFDLLWELKER